MGEITSLIGSQAFILALVAWAVTEALGRALDIEKPALAIIVAIIVCLIGAGLHFITPDELIETTFKVAVFSQLGNDKVYNVLRGKK